MHTLLQATMHAKSRSCVLLSLSLAHGATFCADVPFLGWSNRSKALGAEGSLPSKVVTGEPPPLALPWRDAFSILEGNLAPAIP